MLGGTVVAGGRLERTIASFYSMDQTLDVGIDRGTPVTDGYGAGRGFPLSGTVHEVVLSTGEDAHGPSGGERLRAVLVGH